MTTFDTPAHIEYEQTVQNGVVVTGGSNYDLARGGVATPVLRLPDPIVVMPPAVIEVALSPRDVYLQGAALPSGEPVSVLAFGKNTATLSAAEKSKLSSLKRGTKVFLVGHAAQGELKVDALSKRRAKVAASALPKGVRVVKTVGAGTKAPLGGTNPEGAANRRVEILVGE